MAVSHIDILRSLMGKLVLLLTVLQLSLLHHSSLPAQIYGQPGHDEQLNIPNDFNQWTPAELPARKPKVDLRYLVVIGTRPEAIKLAPVILELQKVQRVDTVIISTGQHQKMLMEVLGTFQIRLHANLNVLQPGMLLHEVQSRVLERITPVLSDVKPDAVLVQGDTTTAMAAALAGFYMKIPVYHVEAGLRSFDLQHPFPEEANRRFIDVVANRFYAPTVISCSNLLAEQASRENVLITGNTVVDALLWTAHRAPSNATEMLLAKVAEGSGQERILRTILVTVHRRENWELLPSIFGSLRQLVEDFPDIQMVFPVHLNPKVLNVARKHLDGVDRIKLLDPFSYETMVHVMKGAYIVLTDSGGLQEEASAFGVPVLLIRGTTERPEGILAGAVEVVGTNAGTILKAAKCLLTNTTHYRQMARKQLPFGDGKASARIVAHMLGDAIDEFTSSGLDLSKYNRPITCEAQKGIRVPKPERKEVPPQVSIILPVYNGGDFLPESVQSILNQDTNHPFELVVINDRSTDSTASYLASLKDPRVRVITNAENKGLPATLNIGYRAALGKYITWTSADNLLMPNFLNVTVDALEEFPEAKFAHAGYESFGAKHQDNSHFLGSPGEILTRWRGLASFLWHRDVIAEVGAFSEHLQGVEDWDYWLRILEQYPASPYIDKIIFRYRIHGDQLFETMRNDGSLQQHEKKMAHETPKRFGGLIDAVAMYPAVRFCSNRPRCLAVAWWKLALALSSSWKPSMARVWKPMTSLYYAKAYAADPGFVPGALAHAQALAAAKSFREAKVVLDAINKADLTETTAQTMFSQLQKAVKTRDANAAHQVPMCKNAGLGAKEFNERSETWTNVYKRVPQPTGAHRPYRLAVVPSDPLAMYVAKLGDAQTLAYFNPLGFFDEVYILSPFEKGEKSKAYGMTIIPTKQEELRDRLQELSIHIVRADDGSQACNFAEAGRVEHTPVVCYVHNTSKDLMKTGLNGNIDFAFSVSQEVSDALMEHGVPSEKVYGSPSRTDMQHGKEDLIDHWEAELYRIVLMEGLKRRGLISNT